MSKYLSKESLKIFTQLIYLLVFPFILLACASVPPSKTLPQAKVAVDSVDHANYRNYVNDDIDAVKSKLAHAQEFEAGKKHNLSEQLAQQILVRCGMDPNQNTTFDR